MEYLVVFKASNKRFFQINYFDLIDQLLHLTRPEVL